jgi:AdoMet-dependent rRNA methyltransferase SPB1
MQLKMTAPLDIGLEQTDPSLGNGMDDMFDLGVETSLRKRHRISTSMVDRDEIDSDDSDGGGEMDIEDDDVVSDDGAKRVAGLEDELDGLYESYQERMRERDAKYRVKESKQKDPEREEWRRVQDSGSEDERSVSEGGWDEVDEAKRRFGEDSSSSEESGDDPDDDNLDDGSTVGRKHRRSTSPKVSKRVRIAAPKENARAAAASRVWFSQDLFSGIGDLDVEDAEDEGEDNNEHDPEWQSEVSKRFHLTAGR